MEEKEKERKVLLCRDFDVPEHTVRVALLGNTKEDNEKFLDEFKANLIETWTAEGRADVVTTAETAAKQIEMLLMKESKGKLGMYNPLFHIIFLFLDKPGMRYVSEECWDYEDIVLSTFNHEVLHHIDATAAFDGVEARAYMMTAMTKAFWPKIKKYIREREKERMENEK